MQDNHNSNQYNSNNSNHCDISSHNNLPSPPTHSISSHISSPPTHSISSPPVYPISEDMEYADNYEYDGELKLSDNLILRTSHFQFNSVFSFFRQYPSGYWRIVRVSMPNSSKGEPAIIFDTIELIYQKLQSIEYPIEYVAEIIREDREGTIFINIANTLSSHIARLKISQKDKKIDAKIYSIKCPNRV